LEWALLLAVVALVGHIGYHRLGMPRMVGYALVGGIAGLVGFSGATWPMHGVGLFLLQLGMTLALFEAGTRLPIRWFVHNPMVLVQSLLEAVLTFVLTYLLLRWWGESAAIARMVAMVTVAASPATLLRLVHDLRAAGPVTDRALVLASLNNLYALVLGGAMAAQSSLSGWAAVWPPLQLLGMSLLLAAGLAVLIHLAWRAMRQGSESAAAFVIALLAASVTVGDLLHGSAPLAALMAGAMLRYAPVQPMVWLRRFEGVSSMFVMMMFVLVATTAAQVPWSPVALILAFSLIGVRLVAKVAGTVLGSWRSGMGLKKSVWLGPALMPASHHPQAERLSAIALPLILICEVLGAVCAAFALRAARETVQVSSIPSLEGRHDA
jgi:Kef-type K+ transport system membrane component KefB